MSLQIKWVSWPFILVILIISGNLLVSQDSLMRPCAADCDYVVYFVGNTGSASMEEVDPTLHLLSNKLGIANKNSAVVILGDILKEGGMPEPGEPGRQETEQRIMQLLNCLNDYPGKIVFIPGEQDWGKDKQTGWQSLIRLEEYIETKLNRGNVFIPDNGFPGPQQKKLTDDIRLIAINTQWLLTPNLKPTGDSGEYDVEEDDEFYVELEDIIMKRATKDLIIVGHHPLYSNGHYGGHTNPKAHIFPLTMAWENAYLPLPIIGSVAVAYRSNFGNEQYFCNNRNTYMRKNIDKVIQEHEDYIYVCAHDHSLQLFKTTTLNVMQYYHVCGSAARSEYTSPGYERGSKTKYVSDEKGYSALNYYNNGSVWIDFWVVNENGSETHTYEAMLRSAKKLADTTNLVKEDVVYPDFSDSTVILVPEPAYGAGWFREFFAGSNHRDVWTTPIEVPYFDIGKEHGGLKPVKRGGGLQTTSIRLVDNEGKQYILRSVNKDGGKYLPEEIQPTIVAPISQDFLSYSHPHGAFIVPPLAEAVGVYHTNPKLVQVPDDPRFGEYQNLVGNLLMLYEERPNKDMSGHPCFGNSKDVVGASEVYRKVTNNNDFRIDAQSFARARLLDMWMSDWDRHKDQWRWASFEPPDKKGKIYRPIPRDRDQAFMKLNFFLHQLIKPYFNFQDFRESYGNMKGLAHSGRKQDHRFLSELERNDWLEIADSVKTALKDEDIEKAFQKLPEPVFALQGEEMIHIGKVRREKLAEVATDFYELHARSVDVVGSNKHEQFEVTRFDDHITEVKVFKTSKKGEIIKEIYNRKINRDETDEICLYGLGGNDRFIVNGDVNSGIVVHAVGGTGDDTFIDSSHVSSWGKKTHFYDSQKSDIITSTETSVTISDDPRDNDYTGVFEFPRTYPIAFLWFTTDDGFILTGGALHRSYGFHKDPYAEQHRITGSFATSTKAIGLNYSGKYRQTFGYDWHTGLDIEFANPNNFLNFFGMGNETEPVDKVDSVRVFLGSFNFEVPFTYEDDTGWNFNMIPNIKMANLREDQEEISFFSQPGLSEFTLDQQWFAGLRLFMDMSCKDDLNNPRMGYKWPTTFDANFGIYNAPDNFMKLESELSLYASLWSKNQYTLAIRFGGSHNFGTFPFFAANTLGGTTNLRGYRSTRFSGRSSLYVNSEIRLGLLKIGGEVLPGMLGILGFADVGRVWTDEEISKKWHPGFGGGIWYDIVGEVVLRVSTGFSREDMIILFGPGFFF